MNTLDLTGPDLAYWVARANLPGHAQERNVLRRHYGDVNRNAPTAEASMRAFVAAKIIMQPERRIAGDYLRLTEALLQELEHLAMRREQCGVS